MSIASGTSSVSVSLNGQEMDLETALDTVVRDLQKHLNLVQMELRTIAMSSERDDDYEEMVRQGAKIQDNIIEMNFLFEDLYDMAGQIMGDPETPEEKAFLKQHKAARKIEIAKMKAAHAEQKRKEKEEAHELARDTQ